MKKKKASTKEKVIIAASVVIGVIIVVVMVLNIPIIPVERNKGGVTYTERISIIRYIKELQPLAETEGLLSADTNSYALASGAENVDDKREFTNDQIIEGQFTVLVLGFDESRELSDVMMLFLFDINNHKLDVLQIPRDSFVPDFTSSETGKINSVYTCGDEDLIPIQRTVNAVRETFGIPIDRYVTTGCDDIVDIVDLIGGIPINLPEDVFYSYDKILYAGEQVLDGKQAELMVRARKGYDEGDIGRVKAQRIFMAACMEKALDMGTVELTSFLKEVYNKKLIATDMTLGELSILADFGTLIDMDKVTVQLVPGEGAYYGDYSVWSIHKKATVDVLNKYFRPYQVDLTYDELPITELVEEGEYLTDIYDENQDTLQDIADGATPGESKKKTTATYEESEESDEVFGFSNGGNDYGNDYDYEYDEYDYGYGEYTYDEYGYGY
ncbi:MAG: LCP family protein [Porcipelethomonas sp.]